MPFVNLTAQRDAYRKELESAEKRVLDSGCYIGGTEVSELERELSLYCGAPYVVTCGSGTQALEIALMVLGLEPGDQVIVPDFTFIAPAECVQKLGGLPVFADIDPKTLQIDPESVEKLVGPNTKGIIAVNLFGQCAPYEKLREITDENGLWILEDSAQAFGAMQNGKRACTFGDISITSFYPTKPLGCYGDGGAIFTSNPDYAEKARLLSNHGSRERYRHIEIGVNGRLDALQAAVLRVKLQHLDEELERRRQNANIYDMFFAGLPGFTPQVIADGNTSTFAQYTLIVENRAEFISQLGKAEIPYCIHYPLPLHEQPCFKDFRADYSLEVLYGPPEVFDIEAKEGNPNSKWAAEHVISLPFCAFTDVQKIIKRI